MKIVFFTFYFPPDLSAGSFRSVSLVEALSLKLDDGDEVHVVTTHPNRYESYRVEAEDIESWRKNIIVHRVRVPTHKSGMVSQARSFVVYAVAAQKLCRKVGPDFLIGTTGRLMTGVLTGLLAFWLRKNYFIDLRDIFSEAMSDLLARKNFFLGYLSNKIFSLLDRRLLVRASGVNVVSKGFYDYFEGKGINTSEWCFFPNGVDQEFIDFVPRKSCCMAEEKTVLYAGNIGSGQGLDIIVPKLAMLLGDKFRVVVIGGGSTVSLLEKKIKENDISNVEMIKPVSRADLMQYYYCADVLFLHLNEIPAFERVLPSKVFEYAAFSKPIVAGVSGYSAMFIKENIDYAAIFEPGDYDDAAALVHKALKQDVSSEVVSKFVKKYSRSKIMDELAEHMLFIIKNA